MAPQDDLTAERAADYSEERMFELFLIENGWTSVGYSLTYYPEWLRRTTFPCYERKYGRWHMKWEKEREIDEWLSDCKQRRLDRLASEGG